MEEKYRKIARLAHPVSPKRLPMSQTGRAAQFAPFAALTGYEAVIAETARLTEEVTELDESEIAYINSQLLLLQRHLEEKPEIAVTFFTPDSQKRGGSYQTQVGRAVQVDSLGQRLVLSGGTVIAFENIRALSGAIFADDAGAEDT